MKTLSNEWDGIKLWRVSKKDHGGCQQNPELID